MTICLFDALHTVPMSEGLEHHQTCPKRHCVSEAWMQEQMKGWETADADQKMRGLSLESKDPASKPVSKITDTGKSNANVATFNSFPPIYVSFFKPCDTEPVSVSAFLFRCISCSVRKLPPVSVSAAFRNDRNSLSTATAIDQAGEP